MARFLNICVALAMMMSICPCGNALDSELVDQATATTQTKMAAECHETNDTAVISADDDCCGEPVTTFTKSSDPSDLSATDAAVTVQLFSLADIAEHKNLFANQSKRPRNANSPLARGDLLLI